MRTLLLSSSTSSKSSGSCCSLLLPPSHSLSCWPLPLPLATWGLKAPCASSGLHQCKGSLQSSKVQEDRAKCWWLLGG